MSIRGLTLLIVLASILFGVGLVAPCLTLHPSAGEYTSLVKFFRPSFTDPREVSILGGILTLIGGEDLFIGCMLLLFTIVFPLVKLGVLWCAVRDLRDRVHAPHHIALVEKLGKFSMLDVLVLALLVIAVKQLPGGTEVTLEFGVLAFASSVIISLLLPPLIRRAYGTSDQ